MLPTGVVGFSVATKAAHDGAPCVSRNITYVYPSLMNVFYLWGVEVCLLFLITPAISLRLDLQWELENERVEYILSPSVNCTWADEDYIGKISRVSRRTHPWTAAKNTIQRTLGFYRRVWGEKFNKSYFLEGES